METKSLDLGGEGGDSRLDAMRWRGNSVGFAVGGVVAKNVEYNGRETAGESDGGFLGSRWGEILLYVLK
jgi:hypothetical protein